MLKLHDNEKLCENFFGKIAVSSYNYSSLTASLINAINMQLRECGSSGTVGFKSQYFSVSTKINRIINQSINVSACTKADRLIHPGGSRHHNEDRKDLLVVQKIKYRRMENRLQDTPSD